MNRIAFIAALLLVRAVTAAADTLTFRVVGIDCAACAPPIVKALNSVNDVKSAKVDPKAKTATVDVPSGFDREKLRTALTNAGFDAIFARADGERPLRVWTSALQVDGALACADGRSIESLAGFASDPERQQARVLRLARCL